MCLVASFSEVEKLSQVSKVSSMMVNGKFRSENELKSFLYNLSYMNDMVVKGYMKERTQVDNIIYGLKNVALEWIANNYTDRCVRCCDVIYVYSSGRQYSYHILDAFSSRWNAIPNKYVKWDGIKGGYALTDAEYKKRIHVTEETKTVPSYRKQKYLDRFLELKQQEERHIINDERENKVQFFFDTLIAKMPKVSRYKCVINRKIYKCIELYGEKIGLADFNLKSHFHIKWCTLERIYWDECDHNYHATVRFSQQIYAAPTIQGLIQQANNYWKRIA